MQIYGNYDVVTCRHCKKEYRRLEQSNGGQPVSYKDRDICPHCHKINSETVDVIFMNIKIESDIFKERSVYYG